MSRKLPHEDDHEGILRALVKAIDEADKCPFCGDNQDHHENCIQGLAKKAAFYEPECGALCGPTARNNCRRLPGHKGPHK